MPFKPNYRFERLERERLKKQRRRRSYVGSRSGRRPGPTPPVRPEPKPHLPRADAAENHAGTLLRAMTFKLLRHLAGSNGQVSMKAPGSAKDRETGIEIWDLEAHGMRCALAIDGLIRYVGSREECRRRAAILRTPGDRERQDLMLARALR